MTKDEEPASQFSQATNTHIHTTAATMKGSSSGSGDVQKEEDWLQAIVLAGEIYACLTLDLSQQPSLVCQHTCLCLQPPC